LNPIEYLVRGNGTEEAVKQIVHIVAGAYWRRNIARAIFGAAACSGEMANAIGSPAGDGKGGRN